MNILIIEDDTVLGEILRDYLEQLGHEKVRVFLKGADALQALESHGFDCAFIDLNLPDMDGVELLEQLKQRDRTLPVIMMSGYPTMESTIRAMRLGASDFLTKPFTMRDLALAMERVFKERNLLLENLSLKLECQTQEQLKQVNRQLQQRIEEKEKLFHVSRVIDETRSSDDLYASIVDLASSLTSCRKAGFFVYLPDLKSVALISGRGFDDGCLPQTLTVDQDMLLDRLRKGTSPVRAPLKSFVTGAFGEVGKGNGDGRKSPSVRSPLLDEPCSLWPMWIRGELFGFLGLFQSRGEESPADDHGTLVDFLMTKAALAVENMALYESLINNFYGILKSLVSALEAKDPYTGKHSERVTLWAVRLAREMSINGTQIDILKTVGYLHDIGKIGMPDEILNKPGSLTAEEYEIVKKHPVIGESIIKDLGLGFEERSIIRHHHERWDGRGYPDGLAGEDIPLLARIVAVADAFDAMTSRRAYRESLPLEKAVSEIRVNSGKQFDPHVVEAFLSLMERGREWKRVTIEST
ncbi:HD domain-containing protein [Desulfacinum hydrothermale DSM 13146]|uniref:HD domain-containing protein n=1 Tax=Desulfacinum hydrothermale DSM 13146 TaxID=1121390 RepID=A0A1W1X6A3_9BACT|nr:HD domain-containing phosphohydrolase [Desulfacinum hydrothermale]SMC19462.1 HD domain-containing protein [Desulfacinum hydrothermale DSM 13146]